MSSVSDVRFKSLGFGDISFIIGPSAKAETKVHQNQVLID